MVSRRYKPDSDWSTAYTERAEIYDFVQHHKITGFATVAGDRHSCWAGLAAKSLPPRSFAPIGVAFVTGSISAPEMVEALEHNFPKDHPLRPLFLGQAPEDHTPQPTVNLVLRRGVRSCLEYSRSGDIQKARELSNPYLFPLVRQYGLARLLCCFGVERFDRHRICLHSSSNRTQRTPIPRSAKLSCQVSRAAKGSGGDV